MRFLVSVILICVGCGLICLAILWISNARDKAEDRAEKQQADERAVSRKAQFRKHPLMKRSLDGVREMIPECIEKSKADYASHGIQIWVRSYEIRFGTYVFNYGKEGYHNLSDEDAKLFAETMREILVNETKGTGIRISDVKGEDGILWFYLDFDSFCKPKKNDF